MFRFMTQEENEEKRLHEDLVNPNWKIMKIIVFWRRTLIRIWLDASRPTYFSVIQNVPIICFCSVLNKNVIPTFVTLARVS